MKVKERAVILAFYPHARGFAYVVFEGPLCPVDWGMSDIPLRVRTQKCLRRLSALLDQYEPDVLLIREASHGRAGKRIGELLSSIEGLGESRGSFTAKISRKQIQRAFEHLGTPTRHAIVEAISKSIPMLAPYAPPVRKIWNGEDRRMGLFDAAALAMTFSAAEPQPGAMSLGH